VFIDADKAPMPRYFVEGMRMLRVGGLLLGDNAFHDGRVVEAGADDPDTRGIREFNRLMATDERLVSTIVPVRDGLAVGLRIS
jgi:predicted O-methyltransferase YrrM